MEVEDEAKKVVRQYVKAFNDGDLAALGALLCVVAARYIKTGTFRSPAFGQQPTGRSFDAASQARQLGISVH